MVDRQSRLLDSLVLEGEGVEQVSGARASRFLMGQTWESEGLSTLPGGAVRADLFEESMEFDHAMLRRGVKLYGLYQAREVRDPQVVRALTRFQQAGAYVRVRPTLNQRLVVVDRSWALVAAQVGGIGGDALIVQQPVLVRALVGHFHSLWANALSFGETERDTLSYDRISQTIDMLQRGLTDDAAARELGLSVRTIRRRVAAVLELLGADSRFEAGVKAAKAGWL